MASLLRLDYPEPFINMYKITPKRSVSEGLPFGGAFLASIPKNFLKNKALSSLEIESLIKTSQDPILLSGKKIIPSDFLSSSLKETIFKAKKIWLEKQNSPYFPNCQVDSYIIHSKNEIDSCLIISLVESAYNLFQKKNQKIIEGFKNFLDKFGYSSKIHIQGSTNDEKADWIRNWIEENYPKHPIFKIKIEDLDDIEDFEEFTSFYEEILMQLHEESSPSSVEDIN